MQEERETKFKAEELKKKKKKEYGSNTKTVIVAFFLVALVLFFFNQVSNRVSGGRSKETKDEIAALMDYDMTFDYPKTPRDVVKLHCRYQKLFYDKGFSDEELDKLNKKVRQLYCKQLLLMNPDTTALSKLKKSIEEMKETGYSYKVYELPEASQVKKFKKDGNEMAKLEVRITLSGDKEKGYLYVDYLLIKEDDQWKIYGWANSETSAGNQGEQ